MERKDSSGCYKASWIDLGNVFIHIKQKCVMNGEKGFDVHICALYIVKGEKRGGVDLMSQQMNHKGFLIRKW